METEKLTEEQVVETLAEIYEISEQNIAQFSNYLYNNGFYSPQNQNSNLIQLNNNPKAPTKEKVEKNLINYTEQEELLQSYNQFMYQFDMLFKRVADYYSNMLAFDLDYFPKNIRNKKEYKSKEYKDDLYRVQKFLDRFDYKAEFEKVVKNLVINETYFCWLRQSYGSFNDTPIDIQNDDNTKTKRLSKYRLQMMPQKYCRIDGEYEDVNTFSYSLDMSYFLEGKVSFKSYDKSIRQMFLETFDVDNNGSVSYKPTTTINNNNGSTVTEAKTNVYDGAWVFKRDTSTFSSVPFLTSMIRNCLSDLEMAKLQENKNILSAYGILSGAIPLLNKQQSGQTTNATAFKPDTLVRLLKLASNGLNKAIKIVAVPTEDNKFHQYQDYNDKMYETTLKTTSGQMASASRLLYSVDKQSESELKASIQNDYNMMSKLYSQFETFLEYFVNRKTKKYKFTFRLSGSTYPFIREYEDKNLLTLADKGIVLHSRAYAKLLNMKPNEFDRALEEGKMSNWTEDLTSMLQSIHTSNNKSINNKDVGRPKADDNEISDNGAVAKEYK